MPRDASGNVTLPTNDSSPAAPRNVIRSSDFNELMGDLRSMMQDSLSRSGDGGMLAALDMGGFDLTNTASVYMKGGNNLSDIANASTARTNLGLAIGTDVAAQNDRRIIEDMVANSSGVIVGDGLAQRHLIITGDNIDAIGDGNIARGYRLAHTFGGATMTAARIASEHSAIHEAADDPTNTIPQGVALTASFYGTSNTGWGGTAMTPRGNSFAFNAIITAESGYNHLENITAAELNTKLEAGSGTVYKSILQLVSIDDAQGTDVDVHLALSTISGHLGSKVGISFGDMNGAPPVGSTGTLIGGHSRLGPRHTALIALDFSDWEFDGHILKYDDLEIHGNGSMTIGGLVAGQRQIDFQPSALAPNFDVRLYAEGGTAGDGNGTFGIIAATIKALGQLEIANVAGFPDTIDSISWSADNSGLYASWRDPTNVQKRISFGPWVVVP